MYQSENAFRSSVRLFLRPFRPTDAVTLQNWMNDPEVTQHLMGRYPVSEQDEIDWVAKQGKDHSNVVLAIVARDGEASGILIGSMGLHQIDLVGRTATTGAVIGNKEYWGRGYGSEAKMLLLDYAFNTLGLENVLSRVKAANGRSLAYAHKCGYLEVGRVPNWHRLQNGQKCDDVYLVATPERFKPLWEKFCSNQGR